MAFTRSRVGLMALLLVLSGLMLIVVPRPQAAPLPDKARRATSVPRVYALLHVGKAWEGFASDLYLEDAYRETRRMYFKSNALCLEDWRKAGIQLGPEWYRGNCVLDQALDDPEIVNLQLEKKHPDAKDWVDRNLRSDYLGNTPVLRIWLADGSPEEQVVILNALLRTYLRDDVDQDRNWMTSLMDGWKKKRDLHLSLMSKEEAELLELSKVVPRDEDEQRTLEFRRAQLRNGFPIRKETVRELQLRIDKQQDRIRSLPHVLKWSEKPEAAE